MSADGPRDPWHTEAAMPFGDEIRTLDGAAQVVGVVRDFADTPPDRVLTPARRELVRLLWDAADADPYGDAEFALADYIQDHPDVAAWARGLANNESEETDER